MHPRTDHGTQDHSLQGRQVLGFFVVHPQLGEHPHQSLAHTRQIPRREAPHENQHLLLIQGENPRTEAYPYRTTTVTTPMNWIPGKSWKTKGHNVQYTLTRVERIDTLIDNDSSKPTP